MASFNYLNLVMGKIMSQPNSVVSKMFVLLYLSLLMRLADKEISEL